MPPFANAGGDWVVGPNCVAAAGLDQAPQEVVGRKSAMPNLPPRCLKRRRVCVCFCFLVVTQPVLRLHLR